MRRHCYVSTDWTGVKYDKSKSAQPCSVSHNKFSHQMIQMLPECLILQTPVSYFLFLFLFPFSFCLRCKHMVVAEPLAADGILELRPCLFSLSVPSQRPKRVRSLPKSPVRCTGLAENRLARTAVLYL